MSKSKCPFPPIFKKEKVEHYVKRCMNMSTIASVYPNRKKRKKVLQEYFKSTSRYERHGWYDPEKYLYQPAAAEYLGVSYWTLSSWVKKKYINPGVIIIYGRRRKVYEKKELDKIKELRCEIKSKKQKSNSN